MLRPRREGARQGADDVPRRGRHAPISTRCWPTTRSTPSSWPPRCRPTTRWASACSRPASTPSSRSRWRCRAVDAEDLLRTAEARDRRLMVGHLLEYHPGVRVVKQLLDDGELGRIFYVYANRLNLGKVRPDENALWSLGPHDISVINFLTGEEPEEVSAPAASATCSRASKTWSSATSASRRAWSATCTSAGSTRTRRARSPSSAPKKMVVFDDMEPTARSRSTTRAPWCRTTESYGEYVTLHFGDIHIPRIPNDEPLQDRGRALRRLRAHRRAAAAATAATG